MPEFEVTVYCANITTTVHAETAEQAKEKVLDGLYPDIYDIEVEQISEPAPEQREEPLAGQLGLFGEETNG